MMVLIRRVGSKEEILHLLDDVVHQLARDDVSRAVGALGMVRDRDFPGVILPLRVLSAGVRLAVHGANGPGPSLGISGASGRRPSRDAPVAIAPGMLTSMRHGASPDVSHTKCKSHRRLQGPSVTSMCRNSLAVPLRV